MKISVYTLSDPITSEVKYVGITQDLISRYSNHLLACSSSLASWVYYLNSKGETPIMTEIFICETRKEALEKEIEFVKLYSEKYTLLNCVQNHKKNKKAIKKYKINYLNNEL